MKICLARALRLKYRISLPELATSAGVSRQLVGLIELEEGRWTPGHEMLLELAFTAVLQRRREETERLAAELAASRGGLFSLVEEEYHHVK